MAADSFKTTSGTQAWDLASNWSAGAVPGSGDDVTIPGINGAYTTVSIAATDPAYTVQSLTITRTQNSTTLNQLIDAGKLTVTGPTTLAYSSQFVVNNGSATLQGTTSLSNYSLIQVGGSLPGTLTLGTLSGTGSNSFGVFNGAASIIQATGVTSFTIEGTPTAQLTIGQTSGSDSFALDGGTLALGNTGTTLTDTLIGSTKVTTLDLTSVVYHAGESAQVTLVSNQVFPIYTVKLQSASGQTLYTINTLEGPINGPAPLVNVSSDAGGGTLVSIACYTPGTLIGTVTGEVQAGELAVGDRVITISGDAKPIRWIGRRSYAGRFLARQLHLLPVRIQAGALGGGLPRRDLLVSPCHAMLLDGVLVPAASLVNGSTIVQEQRADRVDYVHIELAEHDVIFAEGAPSETFLDDDSRNAFHNAADFAERYWDAPAADPVFFAPRVTDGFALEAIRARLETHARASRAA